MEWAAHIILRVFTAWSLVPLWNLPIEMEVSMGLLFSNSLLAYTSLPPIIDGVPFVQKLPLH